MVFLPSCGDPIKFAQDLDEARVLGVRVEGERGFASAQPGEELSVALLVAGPDGPLMTEVAIVVCEAADSARGVPFCEGEEYARQTTDEDAALELSLDVPKQAKNEQRLAVLGVACERGTPEIAADPLDFSCTEDEARPLRFSFDAQVLNAPENKNPDLSRMLVSFDGEEVELEAISQQPDCAEAIEVSAEGVYQVEMNLGEEARQQELTETLQLSHFSTAGRYERHFSVLYPEPEPSETVLEWEASSEPGPVKHYLVVRDDGGGVSWTSWSVCVR